MKGKKQLMNDPNQETIDSFYAGIDVIKCTDPVAEMLFDVITAILVTLDNNRGKLFFHVFRSDNGRIWSYIPKNNGAYSILWDINQWELFDCFLDAIISESVFNHVVPPCVPEVQCDRLIKKMMYHTINYLYEKRKNNTLFHDFLQENKDILTPYSCVQNNFSEVVTQIKQELTLYAKMFVLLHEFEHILTCLCPEIHDNDLHGLLDQLLIKQIELTQDCQHVRGLPIQEYHANLKHLINPSNENWVKRKEEIYGDLHAFTEMIAVEKHNLSIKDYMENIPFMILSVKLYNMFRTFISIPDFLLDQFQQESRNGITHDELNKNMQEFEQREIELRQVTLYDLTMMYYEYYNKDVITESRRIFTGFIVSSFISTYRSTMQPLIIALQNAIHNYYYIKEGSK